MTNEQTQAEKLAEQVIKDYLKESHSDAIENYPVSYDELRVRIAEAISQATAELQQKYDLLKDTYDTYVGGDYFVKGMAKLRTEVERLKNPIYQGALESVIHGNLIDKVKKLETERDQAQAQVAALACKVGEILYVYERAENMFPFDNRATIDHTVISQILASAVTGDTQTTANAHDAKVRKEAREACVRDAKTVVGDEQTRWAEDDEAHYACDRIIENLGDLLPQAETEKNTINMVVKYFNKAMQESGLSEQKRQQIMQNVLTQSQTDGGV